MLYADRPPEELAGYTGFLLGFLGEKSRARFFQVLAPRGFHPREFGLMTILAGRPGITQQDLAGLARIDPSSMVAVLDGLEERGLVERRVDTDDRRRRAVSLTGEGRATLEALQGEARKIHASFMEPLTEDERKQLNGLLRKLAGLEES